LVTRNTTAVLSRLLGWQTKSTEAAPSLDSFSVAAIRKALKRAQQLSDNGQFKE
jgi:hypothetical protein